MKSKAFEEKSLRELENQASIENYKKVLESMKTDRISRELIERSYGYPINIIYSQIESARYKFMQENSSEVLFPGETIVVYPGIRNQRAKKEITCDFSSGRIRPGSFYVSYRPMVKNINNGDTYVLKRTIKVENGYEWMLPTTIADLDALEVKLQVSDCYEYEDGVNYSHLSQRMGGELKFMKLKRRK